MTTIDQGAAARQLDAILACHPPRLRVAPSKPPEILAYPSRSWYDLHLDENLALCRVTSAPDILHDIDGLSARHLDELRENGWHAGLPGKHLPQVPRREYRTYKTGILGAVDYFMRNYLMLCLRTATRVLFYPSAPTWPFFLVWGRVPDGYPEDGLAVDEKYGLYLPTTKSRHPDLAEEERSHASKQVVQDLQALIDRPGSSDIGAWWKQSHQ
uniref:Uncharacterized protein n=1 Tax=Mycena chlorophos TaxID=658473 RepID=A0ABQ0LRU1_MYCCL|nr:predicted protein [Mycena chlorophos]